MQHLGGIDVQNQALEQQAGPGSARRTEQIISLDLDRKERLRVDLQVIKSGHAFLAQGAIRPAIGPLPITEW